MKRIFLSLLTLALVISVGQAQDAKKQLKNAGKSIAKYLKDPGANEAQLESAMMAMESAFDDQEFASMAKSWNTRGKLYNQLADAAVKTQLLNPGSAINTPNAAVEAYQSFKKAMELATKGGDTKDALKGLIENENHSSNYGITMFSAKDYKGAFENFAASVDIKNILEANEKESILADPVKYNEQVFYTAVSGFYADMKEESKPYFLEAKEAGTDQPAVYECLYKITEDVAYLNEGREKFPDDNGLLFAEINYYLTSGKLDELLSKLDEAKAAEPNNMSVILTIANVNDQLQSKALESGDAEAASTYFNNSLAAYNEVLTNQPESFDAQYGIGALYYNKAASMTTELNKLSDDFSPAGTKKYEALKAEMDGLFMQALPYFEKAEMANANDLNTLIALKEIAARSNKFDKVSEYKAKIEAIKAASN